MQKLPQLFYRSAEQRVLLSQQFLVARVTSTNARFIQVHRGKVRREGGGPGGGASSEERGGGVAWVGCHPKVLGDTIFNALFFFWGGGVIRGPTPDRHLPPWYLCTCMARIWLLSARRTVSDKMLRRSSEKQYDTACLTICFFTPTFNKIMIHDDHIDVMLPVN